MNKNEKFVITINRELGSGGRTVGRLLAEKLGVPFYDKAVIKTLQEKYRISPDEMFKTETLILQDLAAGESCVVAGRSGFHVFRLHPNHLSVLIQASMEHRMERVARKQGITPEEARKIIDQVDKMRENYVKKYTGTSRYDTRNYQLVIAADGKTEEQMAAPGKAVRHHQ